MRLPRRLLRDRVKLQTFLGTGPYGDQWDDPVEVWGNLQQATQLLATPGGGSQLVDAVTVWLPPQAELVDGTGFVDATAITTQGRLLMADGDQRQLRTVHIYQVRGQPISVELLTT